MFKKWWGTTVFKHFTIIRRCRPYTSFLVGLTSSQIVHLSGLTSVSVLGIVAAMACVTIFHIVSMNTTIVLWRMVECSLTLSVSSLLLRSAFTYFNSLERCSSCLAKCEIASVKVDMTPRSVVVVVVVVAVSKLAKEPMVDSVI
jgi:hypothetical protein